MADAWSDDDWCAEEGAGGDMLRRDAEVQAARMRTKGYTEGVMQCGEDGVKQIAEKVVLEVAPAARVVGEALGIEDAIRDLSALLNREPPGGLPAANAATSARKAVYKFRRATAGDTFKDINAIGDTNLHELTHAQALLESGAGNGMPCNGNTAVQHNLLFVPPCVAAVRASDALLKDLDAPRVSD